MMLQLFVVLAVTAADVIGAPATGCKCNSDADNKEFWAHLTSISQNMDASRDKAEFAVLPGMLSPLVDCDCLEKNRSKRKIMVDRIRHHHHKPTSPHKMTPVRHADRRCPSNYARVGQLCVPDDDDLFE